MLLIENNNIVRSSIDYFAFLCVPLSFTKEKFCLVLFNAQSNFVSNPLLTHLYSFCTRMDLTWMTCFQSLESLAGIRDCFYGSSASQLACHVDSVPSINFSCQILLLIGAMYLDLKDSILPRGSISPFQLRFADNDPLPLSLANSMFVSNVSTLLHVPLARGQ